MEKKVLVHYNHTDPCAFARWTTKESFQFMAARPWQQVIDFYSYVVTGRKPLSALLGNACLTRSNLCNRLESVPPSQDKGGRWARLTFKIVVSYHGGSFDGWQKQPGLNTVQSVVEKSLGKFVDERKAKQLRDKGLPLEAAAVVAGRTDKGVTALHQVCSFYTWNKDVKSQDITNAINSAVPGKLRVVSVTEVSRTFHPNFTAKWRRYVYIFPFNDEEDMEQSNQSGGNAQNFKSTQNRHENENGCDQCSETNAGNLIINDNEDIGIENKPRKFSLTRVNQLLQKLEGKLLSYKMFARDTKPSRNVGPPTECFVFHARAKESKLPCSEHERGSRVMCIELVANRFLRRMVRVLVATAIREAAAGADEDALLKLMDATCRRATAPPAPPDGLCLVDVGYEEFDPQDCLISKE
ncbi:hypothetical protein D8674_010229 [Pyrus ussuriensis x Pyrus communis]|uniref:tRNA pseudouridine synthase n=1 Tax=Pyrus ussuriensis x Pyrus communis TaxID=2448454 RepID=A0A5N5FA50_9ROSA|nr:hypothetical protein D8674_010229 [Pyrus ussuriensis x Pyrus communis]